jgi:hypothetical protein
LTSDVKKYLFRSLVSNGRKTQAIGIWGGFTHKIVPRFPRGEYYCNKDEAKKNQGFNMNDI